MVIFVGIAIGFIVGVVVKVILDTKWGHLRDEYYDGPQKPPE